MAEARLRVVARVKAAPESVHEVRTLLSSLVAPTRREAGCITYELLQNRHDPTDFTFVEEWESEADLNRHAKSDHLQAVNPRLKEITAERTDIRLYSLVE